MSFIEPFIFETSHLKKIQKLSLKRTITSPNIAPKHHPRAISDLKMHHSFEDLKPAEIDSKLIWEYGLFLLDP